MEKSENELDRKVHLTEVEQDNANKDGYYVNINGEVMQVDVKDDSEYACLLNCLEGCYLYGDVEEDDEEDDEEEDDNAEDEVD